jgi:hypothetical protein
MANTGFLSVSDASFDGIKQNIKTFIKAKTDFKDYDFEGSNLSSLIDVMSYNTYMNAFYLNMIGSEMFLDTTQMKESAVSHAKELNYLPRSRTSARALVTMTISVPNTDNPDVLIIPENYTLRATVDQKAVDFTTDEDIIVFNKNHTYSSGRVYVYEGKIATEYFTVDTASTKYILESENIDTNSIKVTVINSETDSSNSVYSYAESLFGLDSTSEVYFLQGYKENQYELIFGDGICGKALVNGNIVKVKYRSTNGELGNKVSSFSSSKIDGKYAVNVTTNVIATDGSEREDIESIKFYSPRHFTTQGRAVTKDDYTILIRNKFPQIKTVGVYGGEDAVPPQYGKVIITPVPYGNIPFLSSQLKRSIIDYLNTKNLTTEPVIYDPEYLFLRILTVVSYNPSLTNRSDNQIKSDVLSKIQEYDSVYLTEFGSDFRKSKLMSMVDSVDPAIVSNDTVVRMIYKITPVRGRSQRYNFSFSNLLYRPVQYTYQSNEQEIFQSSLFSYVKNNVIYNNVFISDDGVGNLRLCYNFNGERVVLEASIGTIDYLTGTVSLEINPYNYTTSIDFYARPDNSDVTVNESKFLKIDYSKIVVLTKIVT